MHQVNYNGGTSCEQFFSTVVFDRKYC